MKLSPAEAEYLADHILDEAGVSNRECTPTPIVARALLGPGSIQIVPRRALRSPGSISRVGNKWMLYLQHGAPPSLIGHVVGHELGHWIAKRDGVDVDEDDCNWIGAALVVPRRAVKPALLKQLRDVAIHVHSTQSLVALRVGEALDVPLALVAPQRVRVRGPEEWCWPPEETIRRWSRKPIDGLEPIRITDGRGRIVLVARES